MPARVTGATPGQVTFQTEYDKASFNFDTSLRSVLIRIAHLAKLFMDTILVYLNITSRLCVYGLSIHFFWPTLTM